MRWNTAKNEPKVGDTKIKVKFLWWPVWLGDEVRWAERAAIEYEWRERNVCNPGSKRGMDIVEWVKVRFVDEPLLPEVDETPPMPAVNLPLYSNQNPPPPEGVKPPPPPPGPPPIPKCSLWDQGVPVSPAVLRPRNTKTVIKGNITSGLYIATVTTTDTIDGGQK